MPQIESILKNFWGYDAFRPLQKEIIESLMERKDTLAILPTGGGKSICFQVPALAEKGICIVISPLIALMKDQVENLKKRNIPALLIHSGMQKADVIRTLKNAKQDYFKFLYVSPERLETSLFKEYLPSINVNFIAVDEAHCISQWGYDFRPSYLRIAELRKELPGVPILALTASATADVQKDICEKLEFRSENIFRQSFERKNISYSVFKVDSRINKLLDVLAGVKGTGIVYCKSRKRTTEVAQALKMNGIAADFYHAGLNPEQRNTKQQEWIDGKTRIMVCTNAFGMGIDKPDVRTVVHIDSPDCLENYYQEAGRAGRDGKKSYTVLLYDQKDIKELKDLHLTRYPDFEKIRHTYNALVNFLQIPVYTGQDQAFSFNFENFIRNFKLKSNETLYALKAIEQDGWIELNEKNFSPSTVVFTTTKNGLQEFQEAYPQWEPLVTSMLRAYEGIFDYPAFISESFLAKNLRIEEAVLVQQLRMVASFGIIRYAPQNNEPQLVFRKNRVMAEELSFDHKSYNRRRKVFSERVNAMLDYIGTKDCRSRFINNYFGDSEAKDCGICDNCLEKKATSLTKEEFDKISIQVLQLLSNQPYNVDSLLKNLKNFRKEKAWSVISFLQAEKKIRQDEKGNLVVIGG